MAIDPARTADDLIGMNDHLKGLAITTLGVLLVVPDSLFVRLIAGEPMITAFWRGLIGGGILTLAFLAARGWRLFSDIRALGPAGIGFVLCFNLTTFCFVFAVRETSVANTLFLVSVSPVFSALISWVALGSSWR